MNESSKSPNSKRDYQYLATALVLIAGFISLRACYALPRSIELFVEMEVELSMITRLLVQYHMLLLPVTLLAVIISLVSVWWRYPLHSLVVALGLVWLWLGAHVITMAASQPLRRMMEGFMEA